MGHENRRFSGTTVHAHYSRGTAPIYVLRAREMGGRNSSPTKNPVNAGERERAEKEMLMNYPCQPAISVAVEMDVEMVACGDGKRSSEASLK